MASGLLDLRVIGRRQEAACIVSLELAREDGAALPPWEPGAHIDLNLPNGMIRQYSLCGQPDAANRWRIAVLDDPQSRGGSRFIHRNIAEGDRISVSPPRNHFRLVEAQRYIFVAGGIGITPLLPMLRQVSRSGTPWRLLYGGRTLSHMAFIDEVKALPGGTVEIIPQDQNGPIDLSAIRTSAETALYCCGPNSLIDAVEKDCSAAPHIFRERFAAAPKPAMEPGGFEVELARSGVRLIVLPFQSLLDVLEEAGCEIARSCKAGICGTCLVRVLAGVPDHRDDILTETERAASDVVLTCVSRSKTPLLVLDL